MLLVQTILSTLLLSFSIEGRSHAAHHSLLFNQTPIEDDRNTSSPDVLPSSTRAHWMRVASSANYGISPCPFGAFGSAVVNHTLSFANSSHPGELICTGVNDNKQTGNPTLHGEMAAFTNCSNILTDADGAYKLSAAEAVEAWKGFSLYTTAEPCPMCAGAIAWAGLREMVYGTSIERLVEMGWPQIELGSREVFDRAWRTGLEIRVVEGVLGEEMDGWFGWQFGDGECPEGCKREEGGCVPEV